MKYHTTLVINVTFLFSYICPLAKTEVYTAIADLGQLLDTDREIIKALENYLAIEQERITNVRWLKEQFEKVYKTANQDEESFLTNPINAFLLVKRLSEDWQTTNRIIEAATSKVMVQNVSYSGLLFPDREDLSGAATALLRLQDTYLLETSQLARGEIEGAKSRSLEFTAGDCFQLGYQAVALEDYKRAIQWLEEALDRLEREELKSANKPSILEFLAHCAFKLNNVKHAIKITRQLLAIAPTHPRAHDNLLHYESVLNTKGDTAFSEEDYDDYSAYYSEYEESDEHDSHSLRALKRALIPAFDNYEKLCRGEHIRSYLEESRLKCRYTTNNNNYLLLQPVKQEILSLDPFICMFHDVISDKDIELFKQIALPLLERATVTNPKSGVLETATYRVSKSAWLKDVVHPRIAHASQVVKDITGLETSTAEELHIINYGIGGHYEPHYDFKKKGEADGFAHLGTGNRIATWIYYLSDVDAGGATVFPKVGVSVKPRKGSAAFWYNLRQNGEGDLNTIHAACPVLSGSKWVGNKWLHEKENEFRRKCSLNSSD
ncbi:prolyl 4-hydroxylase subunit alpha-1-like [Argiope bruennichi]|uniref:prolyl 4-hydroxylase subunit alpha-1-like n=1 Tax=Argiope bruennichi TaxID=94029 RepID=UPI00249409AC|nr:prolyl 4-hydroxylase subunit alpha-1-like [Argiope bruennichi]